MSLCNHKLSLIFYCHLVAPVDSPPGNRFRNFISCAYMYIWLKYMHMNYIINVTYLFKVAVILSDFLFSYMVKIGAFKFGSVVLHCGYIHRRNYVAVNNANYEKFHILHFFPNAQGALRNVLCFVLFLFLLVLSLSLFVDSQVATSLRIETLYITHMYTCSKFMHVKYLVNIYCTFCPSYIFVLVYERNWSIMI